MARMRFLSRHSDGRHFPIGGKRVLPRIIVPKRTGIGFKASTTDAVLKPFLRSPYEKPELYAGKPVPAKDVQELKKAIRLYIRTLAEYRRLSSESEDEMRAWGAPVEDFMESGYFDDDVHALGAVRTAYPEIVSKYFVGFSPMYGKEAPHGMGYYDRYGGL